jgi:hypothetical protein
MIFFLHIPKTAGTSVRQMIIQGAGPAAVLLKPPPMLAYMSDRQLAKFPMVTGHAGYALLRRLTAPVQTITFLREPVARVVSQYRYFLDLSRDTTLQRNQFAAIIRGRSLEELLLDRDDAYIEQLFRELQTFSLHSDPRPPYRRAVQHLPRSEVLEQAKRHLDGIDVLGIVERMDESVRRMQAYFGWEDMASRHEMRSRPESAIEIPPSLVELIREHNPMDVALYDYALQRFEKVLGRTPGRTASAT